MIVHGTVSPGELQYILFMRIRAITINNCREDQIKTGCGKIDGIKSGIWYGYLYEYKANFPLDQF